MSVSPPPQQPGPPPTQDRRALRRRADGPPDRASLRREYVAGGVGRGRHFEPASTTDRPRALPHPFDDLTEDFGNDVYQDMLLDAQVAACIVILKASILEDGVLLATAVPDQADPRHEDACRIRDLAAQMLRSLETPLADVLWSMLDALAFGNKVAELVYRVERVLLPPEPLPPPPPPAPPLPEPAPPASPGGPPAGNGGPPPPDRSPGPGGGPRTEPSPAPEPPEPTPAPRQSKLLLNLVRIKPKPRQHVAFVVDPYLNVVGIIGVQPGPLQGSTLGPGAATEVRPDDPRLLPRTKFAVLTFRPQDGDPRGTSVLRPAYEPWWRKRSITGEYLAYLSQFAGPSIWATTPEGVEAAPITDSLGNPEPDPDPPPDDLPPDLAPTQQQQLYAALETFQNGSLLVVPFGTVINTIEMQGDGAPFLAGLAQADQQITKAILTQTLATDEGQHQARAAASVHQDVLDTLVRQAKAAVVRMLVDDILRPWVRLNYGDDAARELVPVPSLGTTEVRDQAPLMVAIGGLKRAGYLDDSQLPHLDEKLGLPVRDLDRTPPPPMLPEPSNQGAEPTSPTSTERNQGQPNRPGRERLDQRQRGGRP